MLGGDGFLTPSQLRFQCKKKGEKPRLGGSAVSVYPIGYLQSANQVKTVGINERIALNSQSVQDGAVSMNFVCDVPKEYEPVAVGLKAGAVVEAPPMVPADQAPKVSNPAPEKPVTPQDANAAK
jgi:hypothetical protein